MISARARGFTESVIRKMTRVTHRHGDIAAHPEPGPTKIRFCFPKTDDLLIETGRRLTKPAR